MNYLQLIVSFVVVQITDQMLAHEQIYVPHAKLGTIIIRGNVQNVHMSMIIVLPTDRSSQTFASTGHMF